MFKACHSVMHCEEDLILAHTDDSDEIDTWDLNILNNVKRADRSGVGSYDIRMIPYEWLSEEDKFMFIISGELT